MSNKKYTKPPAAELKSKLTPEQYEVTQACGTEPPFRNAYWDNHEPGLYVDVATGEPLFSSTDKFDSGHRLAQLHAPGRAGAGRAEDRQQPRHGAHRGPLAGRRLAPRPRVRRRAGADAASATASTRRRCASSPRIELEAEGYGAYRALFPQPEAQGDGDADSPRPRRR